MERSDACGTRLRSRNSKSRQPGSPRVRDLTVKWPWHLTFNLTVELTLNENMLNLTYSILTSFGHAPDACSCMPPPTHTHCDLCTNSLNQDGLDGLESSSIGMGFSTTHSLSVPYVSAAATNMPRVSPYVSSLNSTETFSDFVRRLLTSQMLPTYHAL